MPNSFKWMGSKIERFNNNNLTIKRENCDYYESFMYKGDQFHVGDYVLLKLKRKLVVAKLICFFYAYKREKKHHRGIVQLYQRAREINVYHNFNFNEEHEVVEDSAPLKDSISLESIKQKCSIIFAAVDDVLFEYESNKLNAHIYSCRYKIKYNEIVPVFFDSPKTVDEKLSSLLYYTRLATPPSSPVDEKVYKRKSVHTAYLETPDIDELDMDKVRSITSPLKRLRLTPNSKSLENDNKRLEKKAIKRVLVDSFDDSCGVSYAITNSRCDKESIKIKFTKNVKVVPTQLSNEVMSMKSPIKMSYIMMKEDRIELSSNGKTELAKTFDDLKIVNSTPKQAPAKINLRRSTRTAEKISYSKFFSSSTHLNSTGRDAISLRSESQQRTRCGLRSNGLIGNTTPMSEILITDSDTDITFEEIENSRSKHLTKSNRYSIETDSEELEHDCDTNNSNTNRPKRNIQTPRRYTENTQEINLRKNLFKLSTKINDENTKPQSPIKSKRSDATNLEHTPKVGIKKLNRDNTQLRSPIKPNESVETISKSSVKNTPTARAKMIREGIITPSVQARKKAILKDNTPLSKARNQLHVSYVPKALPCREKEFQDIANFLEGKLFDGCGGCMYVSGVPGTGKTATVTDVISTLQDAVINKHLPSFKYVNINGMRLSEPRQAYVEITKQLMGKTVRWEQAQTILENMFVKSRKKSSPIIMVVDELDILCTKRQDVVYNLLDWPTKSNSQLMVVTIANTMDLPERLLMGRVTSRLGLTRLTFQAYTHKQLQEIVSKRLMGTDAFNPDAIQLVARKVASVSGDARRALDICRRAAEIAEQEGKFTLVSMVHVNQALNAMITQPKVQAIKRCSRLEKLILQSVVAEVERTGVEETNFISVFRMLVTISALDGFQMVSKTIAAGIIARLGALRLLLTDHKCNDIHQRIILNASSDDVHYALTNVDI